MNKIFSKASTKAFAATVATVLCTTLGSTNVCAAEATPKVIWMKDSYISSRDNYKLTSFKGWKGYDERLCAGHIDCSEDEVYEAARVLHHEACGFGDEGRMLVANVIANRVVSDIWPDTVEDVVFQRGQFGNGKGKDPCEGCLEAAKAVLNDDERVLPCYIMNFQSISENYWEAQGYEPYCEITLGKYTEYFCYKPENRDSAIEKYIVG